MPLNAELLRSSLDVVTERQPRFTARFYEILFDRYPQARPLFSRNAPETQQKMLQEALIAVLEHLDNETWLASTLTGMGAKHVDYGVTEEMYGWVGESLIATLSEIAGNDWTQDHEVAWTEAYGAISGLMIQGARDASA